jgi:hypothetical protein
VSNHEAAQPVARHRRFYRKGTICGLKGKTQWSFAFFKPAVQDKEHVPEYNC